MSIPEFTKGYLTAKPEQRKEMLREAYRLEAAKEKERAIQPKDFLSWHLSRLEEYSQRMLVLGAEVQTSNGISLQDLLKTDAFTCTQIAASGLAESAAAYPEPIEPLYSLAKEVTFLLDCLVTDPRSEEVLQSCFELTYVFAVIFKHAILSEHGAALSPEMKRLVGNEASQLFSSKLPLVEQVEGVKNWLSLCRN